MFYIAEALLIAEGLSYSKHSAVISAFNKCFVKTARVPAHLYRDLVRGQQLRHGGDYGQRHAVTFEQAEQQIRAAEKFLKLAEELIGPLPPESR